MLCKDHPSVYSHGELESQVRGERCREDKARGPHGASGLVGEPVEVLEQVRASPQAEIHLPERRRCWSAAGKAALSRTAKTLGLWPCSYNEGVQQI